MAQVKPIRINNFQGGVSKKDATIIDDNQLSTGENCFYNQDKNLQTRYGQQNFGSPIPDAVKQISTADATTGWAVTDDGVTLTADTTNQKRGAGALAFNITVATSVNNFALLTNSTLTAVDITPVKGFLRFWIFAPTAFNTNLTAVRMRIGSSAANYYEFTAGTLTQAAWNYVVVPFSAATITGTPVDTTINYCQLRIEYTAGYTDKVGVKLDDIVCTSATYTKPMMSMKYFETSTTPSVRYLHANCGTALWEYDENTSHWNPIKLGLTDGTRFTSTAYKNIMYFSNGVDNYFDYNGKTCTDRTGTNTYKGKYLLLANDVGYIAGDPTVPSTLAYTGGVPANLNTFPNVLVCDEDSSDGSITGLINLGPIVFVMKRGKIYKVNTASPAREQIDYSNGFLSHRALVRVENEVFGINQSGIYTLAQREATVGSIRADALSDDIKQIIDAIQDKTIVSAVYVEQLKNCYFFCDTAGDGIPDTALVFSVLTKKWTTYNNMPFNEAVVWRDSNGDRHIVCANANNGYAKEIEVGTNDNSNEILTSIVSKDFDFGQPETFKTFEMVEFHGFIARDTTVKFTVFVDGVDSSGEISVDSDNYVTDTPAFSLGVRPLGVAPLGGGVGDEQDFFSFKVRIPMYQTGSRIQLQTTVNTLNSQFILTKASIYPYAQPVDIYPNNLIA
jgi:hypothetical protein